MKDLTGIFQEIGLANRIKRAAELQDNIKTFSHSVDELYAMQAEENLILYAVRYFLNNELELVYNENMLMQIIDIMLKDERVSNEDKNNITTLVSYLNPKK
jgi:hypothetical protein